MRFIGNKAKLLDKLDKLLISKKLDNKGLVFCDLFAGTCTVGDYFKDKYEIIANDTLYTSYVISNGKLKYDNNFFSNLGFDPFDYFNNADTSDYKSGFVYNTFAPTVSGRQYFSDENAKLIDFIRNTIDKWFDEKKINENEKYYLIGSLLESVSKVSNVAGVYSAYLKIWDPRAIKKMEFIPIETSGKEKKYQNEVYIEDVNDLINKISGDILYLDPPYTPTQYISQYHVLETIARNDNPDTHGVGAHRENGNQISKWCKAGLVHEEFEKLIANAKFKHIIFSYSDAGIMSKEYIEKVMKRYAKDDTYEFKKISFVKYKSTRAVNKEIRDNTKNKEHYEWLFYMEKADDPLYISPLNYIGGKYEVLPLIKNNLPKKIDTFFDLFGGGGTVSLNVEANKIVYNDLNWIVRDLLEKLTHEEFLTIFNYIEKTIKKYGLEKMNKEAYNAFRAKYNSFEIGSRNPLDLYLLICYGFEHQIRFNSNLEFNNPCGNSGYNQEMLEKLVSYSIRTKSLNIVFKALDYKKFIDEIERGDFVYCDPPYLNSCGAYNDGKRGFNGWDEKQEQELLDFLDKIDKKGVKFMLSNMMERNELPNKLLKQWVKNNNYKVIINDRLTMRNRQDRREIIIVNY